MQRHTGGSNAFIYTSGIKELRHTMVFVPLL